VTAAIIFSIAEVAFAAGPAINKHSAAGQPVLTLDQAINLALQTNRNIANSQYTTESQRYSIDSVRSLFDLNLIPAAGVSLTGGNSTDNKNISAGLQLQEKLEYGTSISQGLRITRASQKTGFCDIIRYYISIGTPHFTLKWKTLDSYVQKHSTHQPDEP
jgi:outer membrane protein TolC